jgi:hypothetical protein
LTVCVWRPFALIVDRFARKATVAHAASVTMMLARRLPGRVLRRHTAIRSPASSRMITSR